MKYNKNILEIKKDIEVNLYISDISTRFRGRDEVIARNLYFYLCNKFTDETLYNIGKSIDRNHATVIHGIQQFNLLLPYFPLVQKLKKILEGKYTKEAYDLQDKQDIEIVYCDLSKNLILTRNGIYI